MQMFSAKMRLTFLIALGQLCFGISSNAQDIGEGAIVIGDMAGTGKAPIYAHAEGDKIEAMAERGNCVAGITIIGLVNRFYSFESSHGRVHVLYFANKEQIGAARTAWMDPKDLDNFTYDCSCGSFLGIKSEECLPFKPGFVKTKWNECFLRARDQKIAEMETRPPAEGDASDEKPLSADDILKATSGSVGDASSQPGTKSQGSPEQTPPPGTSDTHVGKAFTNEDIIAMVEAGLSDKIVIDKIRSMPGDNLDTSTDALIHLKKVGVSNAVIEVMLRRTTAH